MPIHADVSGLLGNALEPGTDGRKAREVKTAFVGDMREGVERDVRNCVTAGSEEAMVFEMLLHHAQRLIALLHPLLDGMHLQLAPAFDEHKQKCAEPTYGSRLCCSKNIHCSVSARSSRFSGAR